MMENTPWPTLFLFATAIVILAKEVVAHKRHSKCDTELSKSINGAVAMTRMEGRMEALGESIGRLDETIKRIDAENFTSRHELADKVNAEIGRLVVDVATLKERATRHAERD